MLSKILIQLHEIVIWQVSEIKISLSFKMYFHYSHQIIRRFINTSPVRLKTAEVTQPLHLPESDEIVYTAKSQNRYIHNMFDCVGPLMLFNKCHHISWQVHIPAVLAHKDYCQWCVSQRWKTVFDEVLSLSVLTIILCTDIKDIKLVKTAYANILANPRLQQQILCLVQINPNFMF